MILIYAAYHGSESLCDIFSPNYHMASRFRGHNMLPIAIICFTGIVFLSKIRYACDIFTLSNMSIS
ncbi:MAG: hypothetical protein NVSMB49_20760 [Ktedonobacteraceae bacterium]